MDSIESFVYLESFVFCEIMKLSCYSKENTAC